STEDKAILYNQLELTKHSTKENVVNDTFSFISEETAEKLKTVDDLIDNNIVSGRLAFQGILTTGTVQDNGYYVVPLFEPIYAAMQNDNGAVGDISFKRNAYELLAQYGYSDGMAAYISDKYANDEEALKAILDTKYNGNLAEFKKDMFALRASKLSYLKQNDVFTDYKELQNLMDAAVQKDLEAMRLNKKYNLNMNQGVGAVRTLKTQILQSYLKSTDDFTTSIYEEKTEEPVVPPVEEEKPEKPGVDEEVKPNPPSNDEETEKPEVPDNGVVDKEEEVIFDIAKPTDIKITSSKLEGKKVDYIVVNSVKITKASMLKLTVRDTLVDYNDEYYIVNDGSIILLAKLFEILSLDANKGYTISVAFTDGEEIENFATLSVVDSSNEVVPPVIDTETSVPKPSEENSTVNTDKNEQIDNSEKGNQEVVKDKTEKTGDFAAGKIALGLGMMTSLAVAALLKKKK
ncbi:MAG: ZmpA/ZmpB/ZmpC family metallo-endopeptidase, partial [Clostridiaceae bacterium]|nr:ZmpA/ZmpB/ZmpC family metallo-endopeptidase [Clostridiaceae bacterium]